MQRHLVHVGWPKAGSTTLQAWFASRPDLVFADETIGAVTSPDGIAGHVAGTVDDAGRWVVTSAERLIMPAIEDPGDPPAEPIAVRRRRVCERLRAMFGDPTILIVTRGFRGIMASGYSQVVRWGPSLSVDECVAIYQDSFAFEGSRTADVFDYDAGIRDYVDVFGEEKVMVLPYEMLRDDPQRFFARLEERLGLEHRTAPAHWLNASLTGSQLYWYPRVSRVVDRATARLGRRGARLRFLYYQKIIRGRRLVRPVEILSRAFPARTVNPADRIPVELIESCRGRASSLAANPDYAPYAAEYLNDRVTAAA